MSKADEKQLEEAVNNLKGIIEMFYEFPNPRSILIRDYEVCDIETVLKELERLQEDYIPKDKIREKIEKLNENRDMISGGYAISILKESLEGK